MFLQAPSLPLNLKAFKLFLVDVGLLSCMVGLRQDVLLDGNELFKVFHEKFQLKLSIRTAMVDYKKRIGC